MIPTPAAGSRAVAPAAASWCGDRVIRFLVALALVTGCRCAGAAPGPSAASWRPLLPGLDYRSTERDGTLYHLLRVRLDGFDLRVADARRAGRHVATVDVLHDEAKAVATLNGTFFDDHNRPLGLVVSDGRELNPLRDISWWAAFVVREREGRLRAEILTTEQLKRLTAEERAGLRAALQVGPRTVVDGRALKLKNQTAARSAVCVVEGEEIVLVATELQPVESNALAAFMARDRAKGGLGCRSGLMFDGGPSTQLRVTTPPLSLDVRGGWGVPNALVVVPRAAPAGEP